jgi:hypothetical protein
MTPGRAKDVYEQLLGLADRVGAAYVNAYQKITAEIGDAQHMALSADPSDWLREMPWLNDMPSVPDSAAGADPLGNAADRALHLTDALLVMSTKIGLAYVYAHEQAALAAADCQEAFAARGASPLVKTMACARADLTREIAGACASTARAIVD